MMNRMNDIAIILFILFFLVDLHEIRDKLTQKIVGFLFNSRLNSVEVRMKYRKPRKLN